MCAFRTRGVHHSAHEGAAKYIIGIGVEAWCIWVGMVSVSIKEVKSDGRGEGRSDM